MFESSHADPSDLRGSKSFDPDIQLKPFWARTCRFGLRDGRFPNWNCEGFPKRESRSPNPKPYDPERQNWWVGAQLKRVRVWLRVSGSGFLALGVWAWGISITVEFAA